ncbi:miniconductance mechanosensitive channel [Arachidicoccus rhizosphaerae]|uniref:Miniconductance mechanosensitive channel n=2 Tax=Arachidicoccus rhizosphaerae TaxID=551991 RepID=A0A1H4B8L8_9BACT|nr:miniconductance mechanosensitive channel [Arachidicoccus rhizosphaerae]
MLFSKEALLGIVNVSANSMFKTMDEWIIQNFHLTGDHINYIKIPLLLISVILFSCLIWWIARKLCLLVVHKIVKKTKTKWDDYLIKRKVFLKICALLPIFIIKAAVPIIFSSLPTICHYMLGLMDVLIIGIFAIVIVAVLNTLAAALSEMPTLKEKPIFSYIQVINIFVYLIAGILILSVLLGKSPLYFLGAMGAMTAVLMLIFKDTILGFVASIQISAYDMIRVGDWIEMPDYNTDGDVISINLNTVKVKNWDKTISSVPTAGFLTSSFKNWRGMTDTGGRRIKRPIYLKMSSFKFCDEDMIEKFKGYHLLHDYIITKENEIKQFNQQLGADAKISANTRRLTNIGLYRIYAKNYLDANPRLNHSLTTIVRQLDPTPEGLPLQLWCFTADVRWAPYEDTMSDIFDHLLTIAPEFGLEVFESPTGKDMISALEQVKFSTNN